MSVAYEFHLESLKKFICCLSKKKKKLGMRNESWLVKIQLLPTPGTLILCDAYFSKNKKKNSFLK